MSYYDIYSRPEVLRKEGRQLLELLSPNAENSLEEMAKRAQDITLRYFGKTIQLYTPMYLSNYCENRCLYCGFNAENDIPRKRLTMDEVKKEASFISATGLRHILILTGEFKKEAPLDYIKDCVNVLKQYFDSISIEIYPLSEAEYAELVKEGVDGLTIYQEVYDEEIYTKVHPGGPKRDYRFRLDAPERGCRSGMRSVNIGALLGLGEWRSEAFSMGMHAKYLQDNFPEVDIGISIPRLRPHTGRFTAIHEVNDKNIVQIILALRIFLPRLSISVSTRENPGFRENLIGLGVTRMSAGSTTKVGGHTAVLVEGGDASQFDISDHRNVSEIKAMLERHGYQPVFKDWLHF